MTTRRLPATGVWLVIACVAACGADGSGNSPRETDSDSGPRDAAIQVINPRKCTLEEAVADHLEPGEVQDCGLLPLSPEPSALDFTNAQQCVLDARATGVPFRLIHERQGVDSYVAQAYVWGGSLDVFVLDYDSDTSGGSGTGARISRYPCRDITAKRDCVPSANDLCLGCVDGQEAHTYCEGSP